MAPKSREDRKEWRDDIALAQPGLGQKMVATWGELHIVQWMM